MFYDDVPTGGDVNTDGGMGGGATPGAGDGGEEKEGETTGEAV